MKEGGRLTIFLQMDDSDQLKEEGIAFNEKKGLFTKPLPFSIYWPIGQEFLPWSRFLLF